MFVFSKEQWLTFGAAGWVVLLRLAEPSSCPAPHAAPAAGDGRLPSHSAAKFSAVLRGQQCERLAGQSLPAQQLSGQPRPVLAGVKVTGQESKGSNKNSSSPFLYVSIGEA